MAWQESFIIDGVASTGLIAGPEAAGGNYGSISVTHTDGVLEQFQIKSTGLIVTDNNGLLSNGTVSKGGSAVASNGGTIRQITAQVSGYVIASNGGVAQDISFTGKGFVYAYQGGTVKNVNVTNNASVFVSGGVVDGGTVTSGLLKVYTGGVSGVHFVKAASLDIANNGTLLAGNVIDVGAWKNNTGAYTDENGVILGAINTSAVLVGGGVVFSGLNCTNNSKWTFFDGAKALDTTIGNGTLLVSNGGVISGGEMTAGAISAYESGVVSSISVTGGKITVYAGGSIGGVDLQAADILNIWENGVLFGSNTIAAGAWTGNATAFTGADGVISSASIYRNITIGDGAVFGGLVGTGAYTFKLTSGAEVRDVTINGTGGLELYDGALVLGGTLTAGSIAANGGIVSNVTVNGGNVTVADGAEVRGGTLAGGNIAVGDGGLANNVAVNGGNIAANGGGVSNVTVNGGNVTVADGAEVRGGTLTSGNITASEGGVVRDVTVNGGKPCKKL